jgi:hypothetical protein
MKLQQGLIYNNSFGQLKLVSYYMWAQEQDRKWHVNNQVEILHRYFYSNLAMFGFMKFYIVIYQEIDNKIKLYR